MNPVTAINENGILRSLAPLNLPEHVQVRITIQPLDKPKVLFLVPKRRLGMPSATLRVEQWIFPNNHETNNI